MKRSIIAGLNYSGSPYELPDCHLDAAAVAKRAKDAGFRGDVHTGVFGVNDFMVEYERIISSAKKSDTTLFSYSGHGTQWNSNAEKDGYEEGLCFWNGRRIEVLPDDDFRSLIEKIPGSVIVFLDSCFSGGMSRAAKLSGEKDGKISRFIPFDPSFEIYYPPQARSLTRAVAAAGNKMYFLFASQENEVSYSTGQGGLFTRNFCDNYDATARSKRTIKRLIFETMSNCVPQQTPKYELFGGKNTKLVF